MYKSLSILFIVFALNLKAQYCQILGEETTRQLNEHVMYLASEELEGRKPGTKGHLLAQNFLEQYFKAKGLQPAFDANFLQELQVPFKVRLDSTNNYFRYRGDELPLNLGYYPTEYSANGKVSGKTEFVSYGIESEALERDDVDDEDIKGAIAVMEIGSPDGIHPHSAFKEYHDLYGRIENLKNKGAIAVILIDIESKVSNPSRDFKSLNSTGIPVVFIEDADVAEKLDRSRKVAFSVSQTELKHTVANVGAFVNNGRPKTVVIGAHYDHLGRGKENSRYQGDADPIHYGADDNASGTAGLLALANYLQTTQEPVFKSNNYLLMAFTAEEMGLLGSQYLVNNLSGEYEIAYMLNMDMIGRMTENQLQVNGTGTSPVWPAIFDQIECKPQLIFSESGVGPSDHTSFYYQNIPVLHFFTGTHPDYHKPSDIAEKINEEGITKVLNLMLGVIASSADQEIEFTPTKNESTKAPRFSVTLGVMPNYMYSKGGLKLDGVSMNKPAFKAGLKAGDVITKLGDYKISDIQSYMRALSAFKEGQEVIIQYQRDGASLETTVKF